MGKTLPHGRQTAIWKPAASPSDVLSCIWATGRQLSGNPQQTQQMFSHVYGLQGLLSRAIGTKKAVRSRGGEGKGEE